MIDLLALDPLNPRSVLFQIERLKAEIALLPGETAGRRTPAAKEALRLATGLAIREPADMTPSLLEDLAGELGGLYERLAADYFG